MMKNILRRTYGNILRRGQKVGQLQTKYPLACINYTSNKLTNPLSIRCFSNGGKFRNTYRGKRVYVKPHNVLRDDKMLSITPHRGIYEENDNTITLSRPGYLTFDFIDYEETSEGKRANYKERDTFIMTLKNIGDFIKIDDSYSENDEPVIMNYTAYSPNKGNRSESLVHVLKVDK